MSNLVEDILKLKKEKNALILAHNYQRPEVQEIADLCADSLELARVGATSDNPVIVFCGVRFMAETAKILSPEKKVLLTRSDADCPMANMLSAEDVLDLRKKYPRAKVVSYVNSTAEVKAVTDVCCTSANALKVVQNIDADQIIFGPDKNLGNWCQKFTDKELILWQGFCYVHAKITLDEVQQSQAIYPDAVLIVHPECEPEVVAIADQVLSTSQMIRFVKEDTAKRYLIATEMGVIYRMKKENPDKDFYPAGTLKTCLNMKKTALEDVFLSLQAEQYEINLPPDVMKAARQSLEEMINYV